MPKYKHPYGYMPVSDYADFWRDHDASFLQRWRVAESVRKNKVFILQQREQRGFTKNHAEALADAYENELYEAGLNHDEV